jgi:hypothetical protein
MRQCYKRNTCDSKLRRQSSSSSSSSSSITYNSRLPNIRPRSCRLPSSTHSCRKRRRLGESPVAVYSSSLVKMLTSAFRSSNNPFATSNPFGQPTTPVPTPQLPPFASPAPSNRSTPALVQGRPASSTSMSSHASSLPPRTPVSARAPDALSALLASAGSGIDTFGNVGSLRYGGSAYGRAAQRSAVTGP